MTVQRAAHVEIEVLHGSENLMFAGALVGAFFGPVGAGIGATLGKIADRAVPKSAEGVIVKGVETIFVGDEQQPAANADPARTDAIGRCHTEDIAAGSRTVFAEQWSFSRTGDKTDCGGEIADGCPTVFIGGDPSRTNVAEKGSLAAFALDMVIGGAGLKAGIAKGGWDAFFGWTGMGTTILGSDTASNANDLASGGQAAVTGGKGGVVGSALNIFERVTR